MYDSSELNENKFAICCDLDTRLNYMNPGLT